MMRKIVVIGAGKSTSFMLDYFLKKSESEQLHITIVDQNPDGIADAIKKHPACTFVVLDIFNEKDRINILSEADIVVSMLPARFHMTIAKDCLALKKHLVTASYVNNDMKTMDAEVKAAGLIFMNEIGLDPGIDHMSAMQIIDRIRDKGGKMLLFESFTGGLVAPESDTNKWNYKFTWNPRNVVLAGQGGAAKFVQEGTYKYIPYHKLFRRTEFMEIEGYGTFEGYANRDSL